MPLALQINLKKNPSHNPNKLSHKNLCMPRSYTNCPRLVPDDTVRLSHNCYYFYFIFQHSFIWIEIIFLSILYICSIFNTNCSILKEPIQRPIIFRFPLNVCLHAHKQPDINHTFITSQSRKKIDCVSNGIWLMIKAGFWGDRQTKSDGPTDIFSQGRKKALTQGRKNPLKYSARSSKSQPQTSHSADLGTYQASVATGEV